MTILGDDIALDYTEYACTQDNPQAFASRKDTFEEDLREADMLDERLLQYAELSRKIENHAITPSAFAVLQKGQLMAGTAMENLTPDAITKDIALESIGSKITETLKAWASKIVSLAAKGAKLVGDTLTGLWNSVSSAASKLGSLAWDKAKALGKTIKAHPYKTIMIAVAAAATVAGIVMFTTTGFPPVGSPLGAMRAFMTKLGGMFRSIRFPGKKITTKAVLNGEVLVAEVLPAETVAMEAGTAAKLGWTKATVKAIGTAIKSVWGNITKGFSAFKTHVVMPIDKAIAPILRAPTKVANFVREKTGSDSAAWVTEKIGGGYYYSILFKIAMNVVMLIRAIIVKAFEMVKSALSALMVALA